MFLTYGFDFGSHWSEAAVEGLENAEHLLRIGLVIGLPLAGGYVYLVPFVETEDEVFLKTIIPSRKATKRYRSKDDE